VYQTLDNLRNAGIKIWMLTGDKVATAICVAISAGLKSPTQNIFLITDEEDEDEIERRLKEYAPLAFQGYILVIDGGSLKVALEYKKDLFMEISTKAPAVVCCRCSPTQKTMVTEHIKTFTKVRTAAVGDGGNDVGMIQQADIGIGIVGKEGMQAALAADFSINQFNYLNKLLLWHGRLAYKRSAKLSQFVIHRGMILSFIQVVFTSVFYFIAIPIYNGMLMLGYTTIYTTLPVFCLVK
jgi:phospholipid-translocating ATPase